MATINIAEFATIIEATPRDARKFLREVTDSEAQPGKGGRWAIEKRDIRSLRSKFTKWDADRKVVANDAEEAAEAPLHDAVEVDPEMIDDEENTEI